MSYELNQSRLAPSTELPVDESVSYTLTDYQAAIDELAKIGYPENYRYSAELQAAYQRIVGGIDTPLDRALLDTHMTTKLRSNLFSDDSYRYHLSTKDGDAAFLLRDLRCVVAHHLQPEEARFGKYDRQPIVDETSSIADFFGQLLTTTGRINKTQTLVLFDSLDRFLFDGTSPDFDSILSQPSSEDVALDLENNGVREEFHMRCIIALLRKPRPQKEIIRAAFQYVQQLSTYLQVGA